ncbi:A24 family peptidase [Citrobacter braakii]|uniref:A24 family peptidase n=1 Tax=Citrobacter braakii TaxID=57706 RepID=UPI000DF10447|nr:prepilin peptidase [Citrobacter braakii]WAD29374.1 prepilin peptidase [Citrobacter braakii]STB68126.1 prepilin peptidase TadV [Citrobacter freundii]SUX75916.1 prepilin peptidase TadV [Citrobacter freundii]
MMVITGIGYSIIICTILYGIYTDIKFRKIYNSVPLIIIAVSLFLNAFSDINVSYVSAFLILLIGFVLSVFNIWGAGDAKLCFALSLSMPGVNLPAFLLLTSVIGGLMAILMLFIPRLYGKYKTLPYGIAIGCGYFVNLLTF